MNALGRLWARIKTAQARPVWWADEAHQHDPEE